MSGFRSPRIPFSEGQFINWDHVCELRGRQLLTISFRELDWRRNNIPCTFGSPWFAAFFLEPVRIDAGEAARLRAPNNRNVQYGDSSTPDMTPERWRQIEDLYQAVHELPPRAGESLLAAADLEIRLTVERMLQMGSAERFLDRPFPSLLNPCTETVATNETQFGPYQIESCLGAGGMGTVYRAIDTRLGRVVALKVAASRYSDRFAREAQAIATLNHPHICTLYDVGSNYLVMEFIEGSTLAAEIAKNPLPPERVCLYGAQIAEALAEAHARGIVHRDLKPANIMLTRHGVKVLDFGLARIAAGTRITEAGVVMGTPAYMSPEQIEGREPTSATDLFSFGLVLYEMASGHLPFPGVPLGRLLTTSSQNKAPSLALQTPNIPQRLDGLVDRLLQKDPAKRSQPASELARELRTLVSPRPRRTWSLAPAILGVVLLCAGGTWFYQRAEKLRWARDRAIPEATRISERTPLAAFLLLQRAQAYLPDDPQLISTLKGLTRKVSMESFPSGATVEMQDYRTPNGPWLSLGTTPLSGAPIPNGYFRWKLTRPNESPFFVALEPSSRMIVELAHPGTPTDMVHVPKGGFFNMIDFVGWVNYRLPAYDIDRYEVTNRQYQEFIDQGGYRKKEFWKEKFQRDGRDISTEQAMEAFRDSTGRPGPSAWEGGHFPAGHEDYPVSGVSWYEAAAFAEFAHKSLPALSQWYQAAPPHRAGYNIEQSNFGHQSSWRVGSSSNQGPFGTYDMSGNVREWSLNSIDADRRLILGGGWRTQNYEASEPEALSSFDRSEMNGFRCVRNTELLPAASAAPLKLSSRDFSKSKPVSDEVFEVLKQQYAYDHTPLEATSAAVIEMTPDWTKEKVTIAAGYQEERLPLFLFLPKNVRPPLQTVIFFPSAAANFVPSSRNLIDLDFIDYVIKSGRAVVYPIFEGTYERGGQRGRPGEYDNLGLVVDEFKEVRRSIDFLETRPEIDKSKLAYLGVSQGAAYGVIFTALEPRFKTVVFLDGGFFLCRCPAAIDQVNFVSRIRAPVLMVNGRYDFSFSFERAQQPMFRMLGTPDLEKRHVLLDTPHGVNQRHSELSKEVLGWLDKYLGRID